MKAIRVHQFGGPEVLKLEDVPDPVAQEGEAVVRIHAAGVNPYDTYMRMGNYGARNPKLPYTPGSDAAGEIESIGPGVTEFKVGDRVYTTGTVTGAYAEKARVRQDQLRRLPDGISYPLGAGLHVPYGTAYRSLFQLAHARPGEWVLIHGASGGVGIAALQFARNVGLNVIGTAGSPEGQALVKREGAAVVVNHRETGYEQTIMDATGGRGVNVILEMLANVNLGRDLKLLAQRGRVVVIGSRGDVTITPRDLMQREAQILAVMLWLVTGAEAAEIDAAIASGLRNGTLKPIVSTSRPLASASDAHVQVMDSAANGKIVLTM